MAQDFCSRPGCKQECAIGQLIAHIDNLKKKQESVDKLISKLRDMINDVEKGHGTDEESHKVVITKICSFIQTQNTQIKDIIIKYDKLNDMVNNLDKDTINFKGVIEALNKHDELESLDVKTLRDSLALLEKTKIEPLDKWKTQIMTLVVVIPLMLTLIINLIVFHDKITALITHVN